MSAFRATRRRLTAALIAIMAGASLLFAAPAQAYEIPAFEVPHAAQAPVPFVVRATDAAGVLELWKTGGPATRAAAAAALAGGADAIQTFLDAGQDVTLAADRKQLVTELTTRGSAKVRSSASTILATNDPAKIDAFLATGWAETWKGDLRVAATFFLDYGNVHVERAASESLDKGDDAVEEFVLRGWLAKVFMTDRQAAYGVMASQNTAVSAAAKAALKTDDGDVVADFLRYGQFVTAGRDAESTTVSGLLQQVKADIEANPKGTAAVADRAKTAVGKAKSTATAARTADTDRLMAEWKFQTAQAVPRAIIDGARMTDKKPFQQAFAKAAKEVPGLLATLTAPGADLDALINEARQATVDLALVGTPEVRKAAEAALLGGNTAIKDFVSVGHAAAFERDEAALVADRQRAFQYQATGGKYLQEAATEAVKSPSHADVRYFLEYGFSGAQDLDNRILAYQKLDDADLELRVAANVALEGSRADTQAFATVGQFAASDRDMATRAHVASIDAMIAELAGLADTAAVDAGKAADAAKAAEAARQAEATRQAEAAAEAARQEAARQAAATGAAGRAGTGQVDASQHSGSGVGPIAVPWPRDYSPAVGLAQTGTPADAVQTPAATPSAVPGVSVPPAASAAKDSASVEAQSEEAATPLPASSAGMNGWTIGLIVALVLAAAGAITFLLRRKGAASA